MADEGHYSVAVHGRCMIAHSFQGEQFGPAQALHGCTYVVDAICEGPQLQPASEYLIDICQAEAALHNALSYFHERNLDAVEEFSGENTTCERFARAIWEHMARSLPGAPELTNLRIVIHESDIAYVEYQKSLNEHAAHGIYTVGVRGRFMAARSMKGSRFSDNQCHLHGGTFIVNALFIGAELEPGANYLIDICLAEKLVQAATSKLHQTQLDINVSS